VATEWSGPHRYDPDLLLAGTTRRQEMTADQGARFFSMLAKASTDEGVDYVPSGQLQMSAYSNGTAWYARFQSGGALVNGVGYLLLQDAVDPYFYVQTPVNATAQPRIDRAVLRLSYDTPRIRIAYKVGSSAAAPQPPTLQRDSTRYEISLGYGTVGPGQAQLTNIVNDARFLNYPSNMRAGGVITETVNGLSYKFSQTIQLPQGRFTSLPFIRCTLMDNADAAFLPPVAVDRSVNAFRFRLYNRMSDTQTVNIQWTAEQFE
jgi:hypothetical protein